MAARMLVDAAHPEETRVVVVGDARVEDFDFETATRKQLKGNIYLAKVTRVEPSLQAAFVDYGGNRHGFLAFSEIHPDYYLIPIADRQALIDEDSEEAEPESGGTGGAAEPTDRAEDEAAAPAPGNDASPAADPASGDDSEPDDDASETVEALGGDAYDDAALARKLRRRRHYKIQEVIKRRQVILVQVVKEERGTKGAALTTYLSLAGRYSVVMPNTPRGGGISRRIASGADRSRLKTVMENLNVPDGMSLIVRTAGMSRSRAEIKRDFDYLLRLWDLVRERTLESTAPELVYEEANLIKRSIRDLYSRDISEILVEGEEGYKIAKSFMRQLMPSHAKHVQRYTDQVPLFQRHKVEQQLDSMHSPAVHLPSGAYIVINSTEALVAIDVNSGKATRERNIEETAFKTNLEAADEVARQLRLRDLAGLIVIDFIDMEVGRNVRTVERRLKELLKSDRARIQVGRISAFGLLEMSRQRLRPSLLETSTIPCTQCGGTGVVRSTESTALHLLRTIEDEAIQGRSRELRLHVATAPAIYLLNEKRPILSAIERSHDIRISIDADDAMVTPEYRLERVARTGPARLADEAKAEPEVRADAEADTDESHSESGEAKKRRRRGKRGGRRRTRGPTDEVTVEVAAPGGEDGAPSGENEAPVAESIADTAGAPDAQDAPDAPAPKPRRRRRPRRRKSDAPPATVETVEETGDSPMPEADQAAESPGALAAASAADGAGAQGRVDEPDTGVPQSGDLGAPIAVPPAAESTPPWPTDATPDQVPPEPGAPTPHAPPASSLGALVWPDGAEPSPALVVPPPSITPEFGESRPQMEQSSESSAPSPPADAAATAIDGKQAKADGEGTVEPTDDALEPTARKKRRLGWWRRSAE